MCLQIGRGGVIIAERAYGKASAERGQLRQLLRLYHPLLREDEDGVIARMLGEHIRGAVRRQVEGNRLWMADVPFFLQQRLREERLALLRRYLRKGELLRQGDNLAAAERRLDEVFGRLDTEEGRLRQKENALLHCYRALRDRAAEGYHHLVFVSEQGKSTCEACGRHHGRIFAVEDFGNAPIPPLHPNCRCALVAVTDAQLAELQAAEQPSGRAGRGKTAAEAEYPSGRAGRGTAKAPNTGDSTVSGIRQWGQDIADGLSDLWETYGPGMLEAGHLALDAVGLVPVAGEAADLANALVYALEGDNVNGWLSLSSAIPFVGMLGTLGR